MLLRKFRENSPDVLFLILVLVTLTWTGRFINPVLPSGSGFDVMPMPFYSGLLKLAGDSAFLNVFPAYLMVILISYLLVHFNTRVFFISERTFLPAVVYILLTGLVPPVQTLNPVLPAAPFLILGLNRIMDSYKVPGISYSFFDAGALIATGSLFYAGMIWFGLLLVIAIAVMRPLSVRELLISIAGLLTPLFIFTGFYYIFGYEMSYLRSIVIYNLFGREADISISIFSLAGMIIAGLFVLLSLSHLFRALNEKRIKSRKTFTIFFWVFFISAGMFLFFKSVSFEIYWLAAIPLTYFLCHYFVFSRSKRLTETIFISLLVLVLFVQIMFITGFRY